MIDPTPVDHDPFDPALSPTPIATDPTANARFAAVPAIPAPQATPTAALQQPGWLESTVNAIPDWLIPAQEKQAALARANYYQKTDQQPSLTEGMNYGLHTLAGPVARKAQAYAQPTMDLWRNWVAGPLGEFDKFGQNPQAAAAASPTAQGFKTLAEGGTGDPEKDKLLRDVAAQYGLEAASYVGMPGLLRAGFGTAAGELGVIGGKLGGAEFPGASSALERAMAAEAKGVTNKKIFEDTGWRRGKEGDWEFELPDTGMKVKPYDEAKHGAFMQGQGTAKISDLIDHPLLQQGYGDVLDDNVRVYMNPRLKGTNIEGGVMPSARPGEPAVIHIRPSAVSGSGEVLNTAQQSTLVHEIGHVIDRYEGRSPGGQASTIESKVFQPLREAGVDPLAIRNASIKYYRNLAGEARSRTAEARLQMSPDELKAEPYHKTMERIGVPEDQQVIPPPQSAWPKPASGMGWAQSHELGPANLTERSQIIRQMQGHGWLPENLPAQTTAHWQPHGEDAKVLEYHASMGGEHSMGPNSGVKLERGQPGQPDFYIRDKDGRDLGFVNVNAENPKNVHVENIQLYDAWNDPNGSLKGIRGRLGSATVRDIGRQLRAHYPDAKFGGDRFSGARFGGEWLDADKQNPVPVRVSGEFKERFANEDQHVAEMERQARKEGSPYQTAAFHATTAPEDFNQFKTSQKGVGDIGMHFGSTPSQAEGRLWLMNKRGLDTPNARIYPVMLKMDNPLRLPDLGEWRPSTMAKPVADALGLRYRDVVRNLDKLEAQEKSEGLPRRSLRNEYLRSLIEDHGHDGIVYKNRFEGTGPISRRLGVGGMNYGAAKDSYIALRPNQIRSKFAQFDPDKTDSGNILHSTALPAPGADTQPVDHDPFAGQQDAQPVEHNPFEAGGGGAAPEPPTRNLGQDFVAGVAGIPKAFVNTLKRIEGFDAKPKWDVKQWTVGWGTRAKGPNEQPTKEELDDRFKSEVSKAAGIVDRINPKLDTGTRAALTSLTYNTGDKWTRQRLGQLVRVGDLSDAKKLFMQYGNVLGKPNPVIMARREKEAGWFGRDQIPDPGEPAFKLSAPRRQRPVRNVPLPSNPSAARALMRQLPPPQTDRAGAL